MSTYLKLNRFPTPPGFPILGELHAGVRVYKTLELPWKDNQRDVSCIPPENYPVKPRTWGDFQAAYNKRWGHKASIHVAEVPDRGSILIHTGNTVAHTEGCILIGYHHIGYGVTRSREAYRDFYSFLKGNGWEDGHVVRLRINMPELENELPEGAKRDNL